MAEPTPQPSEMATISEPTSNGSAITPDIVMDDSPDDTLDLDQVDASLLSKKRKASEEAESTDAATAPNAADEQPATQSKKAKLEAPTSPDADRSLLPAEVWHHIFSFCPPRTLGNLLMVNKLFNSYLDPASTVVVEKRPPPLEKSCVQVVQPNILWRNARRSFWPKMPNPLKGKTEIEIWRMACMSTCQFCGRRDTRRAMSATDPYRYGPGIDGVARIWEFRVRCCGTCLSRNTLTEMELLVSSGSTFLLPALQFVFMTSLSCVVPLSAIERGQLPPSAQVTKIYWKEDVERLREEFASVRELGAHAAEEWQKGLSIRGSELRTDCAKWDKYDETGGVANMRSLLYPKGKGYPAVKIAQKFTELAKPKELEQTPAAPAPTPVETAIVKKPSPGPVAQLPPAPVANETPKEKTSEEIDAEWDFIQGPVRLKILKYADEAIIGDWEDGDKINKDNAPAFAADVLLHVRKRFYMEVEKDAKAAREAGREPIVDPPEGPFTQKLTLENMKYVFDVKVRPLAAKFRTDLFLCPLCDIASKFFGFEGTLQHYAAKHTNVLSVGNIVVFWRAEWPEDPPFRRNPRFSKTTGLPVPLPQSVAQTQQKQKKLAPAAKRAAKERQRREAKSYAFQPEIPPESLPPPPPAPAPFQPPVNQGMATQHTAPHLIPPPPDVQSFGAPPFGHAEPPYVEPAQFPPPVVANALPNPFGSAAPAVPVCGLNENPFEDRWPRGSDRDGGPNRSPKSPYRERLDELVDFSSRLWEDIERVPFLPAIMKLQTLLYHTNKHYQHVFGEKLPLALFKDRIMKTKEMESMRRSMRVHCYACYRRLDKVPNSDLKSDTSYDFPELVVHFYQAHVGGRITGGPNPFNTDPVGAKPPLDWLEQMLDPLPPVVSSLMVNRARGLDIGELVEEAAEFYSASTKDERVKREALQREKRAKAYKAKASQKALEARTQVKNETAQNPAPAPVREPEVEIKEEEDDRPSTRNAPPAQSAVTRNDPASAPPPPPAQRQDLLGALENHLDGEPVHRPPGTRERPPPPRAPARVVYVDEYGREVVPRHEVRGYYHEPRGYNHYDDGYDDYYGPPSAPAGPYYERRPPPPRRYAEEPVYAGHPREYRETYDRRGAPVEYVRGPTRQEYYPREYADEPDRGGRVYRQAEYEPYGAYEVVRVVEGDNEYLARRPVRYEAGPPVERRAPGERYYASAPGPGHSPAQAPYEEAGVRDSSSRALVRHDRHEQYEYAEDYRGAPPAGYGHSGSARYEQYPAGPVHERDRRGETRQPPGRDRQVAAPHSQRSVTRADPAYYDEYDPHNPSSGGGGAVIQGDGSRQMRYQ